MSIPAREAPDFAATHFGTLGPLDPPHEIWPALEMLECYIVEATGQDLVVYGTPEMEPGNWAQIDDLEFSVDEWLSCDEVAQCIYTICGGNLEEPEKAGETANYLVYYSAELKGQLGLLPKPQL